MSAAELSDRVMCERILEALDRIEAKLDALLAHHGIEYEGGGS